MPTLAELIVKVGANIGGLERGFGAAQGQIDALVKKTRPMADDFTAAGKVFMGFGLAAGAGLGHAASVAADFEAQMSAVKAAANDGGASLARFSTLALQMGAQTKYSATEAGQGITELLKAGVSVSDVMGGGLAGALSLAASGEIEVATAAETVSNALNVFGLAGSQATHVSDLLAAGAGKSATNVQLMGQSFNQSASVAASLKIPIEDLTGTLALFAQNGLKGSDAGTSFKTMLGRLNPTSAEAASMMQTLGLHFYDAQGQFIGVGATAEQLRTKLGGLTDEERNLAMQVIFGQDAIRAANQLYLAGGEGVAKWTSMVNDAGFAARQAAELQNNLKGTLEQLGGAVETAEISIGNAFLPTLRSMTEAVQGGVQWFNNLSPSMKEAVAGAAALTSGVGILGGGMLLMVGQIPNIIQGFGAIKTVWTATTTAASAGGEALKAALLSPVSSCSALTLAVGGAAAAFAGWELGRWAAENIGPVRAWLDDLAGRVRVTGEEVVSANERMLASQGLMAQSTHGLATVTKLLMLAEQEGVGSKEALLARYAPLIQAMERGGTAGEAAFDQAVRMYQADRNAAEAIQKKTVGIDAQRIAFADYLAAQTKGTTATQENTAATAANTAAATSNAAATAALAGQYSQALPAATARASAAVQEAAAIQTQATSQGQMEVAKLSDMWRIGPTGALVQVKSGLEDFGATHGQVIQQAISQLAEYQAQAKVTLTIVENARSQASQSIKDMAGQHHFSGMSGVQSGGYDMGNLFGSAAARNLTSVATGADRERYAIQSLIQSAMGSGISMSETLIQTAKRAVQKYGTSYTSWSSDQIEALKASGGTIPGLARGGVVRRAGTALVGEQGPELLSMPRGASVAPLPAAGMGGQTFITNNYYIDVEGSLISESELFDKVRRGARRHRNANLAADMS